MRTARLGFILSMLALLCFLFACAETAPTVKPTAQAGKKTTIRLGSPFKPGHILVDAGEKFKELIEKGSGGRIAVEMQIGAKSEEEISDLCSKGTIDMQTNGNRPLEVFAPQYFFLGAPYVMKDWDHLVRIWPVLNGLPKRIVFFFPGSVGLTVGAVSAQAKRKQERAIIDRMNPNLAVLIILPSFLSYFLISLTSLP